MEGGEAAQPPGPLTTLSTWIGLERSWRCQRRSGVVTRFVVCGEALIDLARRAIADTFSSTWHALSAGGPMNTAVAMGRLGADVHFLGRLSRDSFGAQLRGHIQKSNVALDLTTESSQSTSIAVVSLDSAGVASYTFHFAGTANFDWQPEDLPVLEADDWLHIASLACVVRPGSEVLLDWTADLPGRDVLRHQRTADGDHRSQGVLEGSRALVAGRGPAPRCGQGQ